MRYVCFLIFFLFFGCYNTPNIKNLNAKHGTELAQKQDEIIYKLIINDPIPKQEVKLLENNIWFKLADSIAPSNLVVRQYCLIDILNNSIDNQDKILNLLYTLSYGGQIWSEGYSYWEYTLICLELWIMRLADDMETSDILILTNLIQGIEEGFTKTAYIRDSLWYPAPFGDVRNEPLNIRFQNKCINTKFVTRSIITMKTDNNQVMYTIKGRAIGLNTHVPIDTFYIEVINGITNYPFYEGYDKKYNNKGEEIKDILRRIEK